jgi:annexin A7/11
MNFNASNDAAALRKAMKGFGTDEDAIIEVLCRRSCAQRMEIAKAFKTGYGKDLIENIKSECRDNFLNLLIALLTPTFEYYARELHDAMEGKGTDEDVLIEVMCGLRNYEIQNINAYYAMLYGMKLEDALRQDTSGCFKRLMVSLACGGRDESMVVDHNQAKLDAQLLKDSGIGRMGTDESDRILCTRNYEQIKVIAREYEQLTGHTLEKDIKKEFSGDVEDGMVALLRCALNRSEFFARRLHKSMAGFGTFDRDLIRLVVTRCEIDMVDIKEAFQQKYGKPLKSFIKGDTSGDYKHALYALIGENRS